MNHTFQFRKATLLIPLACRLSNLKLNAVVLAVLAVPYVLRLPETNDLKERKNALPGRTRSPHA